MSEIAAIADAARSARSIAAITPRAQKDKALLAAATAINAHRRELLEINAREVANAHDNGVGESFVDRMSLNAARIDDICNGLKVIAGLDDPVGAVIRAWSRPNGLKFERVRTPIGVIAIIYESRPNVTVDAAAICLKAGNVAILRGGSDCLETSRALHSCFALGLAEAGLSPDVSQLITSPDRAIVGELLGGLNSAIDMVIPRGGKSLVARVQAEARVPVLSHLDGVCHVYIDAKADADKAIAIALNAKMRRTGVCGAMETLLIDAAVAKEIWPRLATEFQNAKCEIRGDQALLDIDPSVNRAEEEDWSTEYLAPILSVAVVDGVAGAIEHIRRYSSGHTESIVTEDRATAAKFLEMVDSAIVLHNASTQFADGGEFGFGAEIGIATGRIHARGPVSVEELTTYKTLVRGDGQTRP